MTSIEIRKSLVPGEVLASPEMALVEALYGQKRALRSGVPLIHHIYPNAPQCSFQGPPQAAFGGR